MKKKVRRKTLKIATAPQIRLFEQTEAEVEPVVEMGRPSFIDLDPRDIFIGGRRLSEYLQEAKERRALWVREVVYAQDYSAFEAAYLEEGRRPYSPASMVGLILYGLLHGVTSLRDLERMARMDLGCMWVCGGITPDHSSIGRFIDRHEELLKESFFVQMTADTLKRMGLGVGETALDGTVVQAVASAHKTLKVDAARTKLQEAREALAKQPEDAKAAEKVSKAERVVQVAEERAAARKQKGRKAEQTRVSPTEPESMIQPLKNGGSKPSYKPIILATPERVIVGQTVEPSSETKPVAGLLEQANRIGEQAVEPTQTVEPSSETKPVAGLLEQANRISEQAVEPTQTEPSSGDDLSKEPTVVPPTQSDETSKQDQDEVLVAQKTEVAKKPAPPQPHVGSVLADAGFFTDEIIRTMDERGIEFLSPQGSAQGTSWDKSSEKFFAKAMFIYDEKTDSFRCPAGEQLTFEKHRAATATAEAHDLYSTPACAGCAMRAQCTTSAKGRTISRYPGDKRKDELRARMKVPEFRDRYRKRSGWVEPVFSSLKSIHGLVRFARHGLAKVRLEFALHAMAHNLGRLLAFMEARQDLSAPYTGLISSLLAAICVQLRTYYLTVLGHSTRHHLAPCA